MNLSPLTAISPIDGRYRGKTESLDAYFSEFALIRYRVKVEVEYFIALCELQLPQLSGVSADVFESLRAIYKDFSLEDARLTWTIQRFKSRNHGHYFHSVICCFFVTFRNFFYMELTLWINIF